MERLAGQFPVRASRELPALPVRKVRSAVSAANPKSAFQIAAFRYKFATVLRHVPKHALVIHEFFLARRILLNLSTLALGIIATGAFLWFSFVAS